MLTGLQKQVINYRLKWKQEKLEEISEAMQDSVMLMLQLAPFLLNMKCCRDISVVTWLQRVYVHRQRV
jgi:hypothetical protein